MALVKFKSLIISGVVLTALSLTAFAHNSIGYGYATVIAPQDTASVHVKHAAKTHSGSANQNSTGNEGGDLNNAGSPAQVRHDRTGSLNPYSTGSVKDHEGNKGTTGYTGPSGK